MKQRYILYNMDTEEDVKSEWLLPSEAENRNQLLAYNNMPTRWLKANEAANP